MCAAVLLGRRRELLRSSDSQRCSRTGRRHKKRLFSFKIKKKPSRRCEFKTRRKLTAADDPRHVRKLLPPARAFATKQANKPPKSCPEKVFCFTCELLPLLEPLRCGSHLFHAYFRATELCGTEIGSWAFSLSEQEVGAGRHRAGSLPLPDDSPGGLPSV